MSVVEVIKTTTSNLVEVNRLEWGLLLQSVPKQENPFLEQMRNDLILGATNAGTDVVTVETKQAQSMVAALGETT